MDLKKSHLLLLVLGIKKEQNGYEELMGFDQKIEILNKLVATQTKMSTLCVIHGNKKKRCWKRFRQCPIQIYGNSIVSDNGSVSIESLGLYRDGLNGSVIFYCILWGKLYVLVLLRDLERSWDASPWMAVLSTTRFTFLLLSLFNSLRVVNIWLLGSLRNSVLLLKTYASK